MRLLIQRVRSASVAVDEAVAGAIGSGLVVLVGVGPDDDAGLARSLADKVVDLRIFRDEGGFTNRSLLEVGGDVLAVSQFTLFADVRRGRRPSFIGAAPPDRAEALYREFVAGVETRGVRVACGVFGAEMKVALVNDGPMTIWIDSATMR